MNDDTPITYQILIVDDDDIDREIVLRSIQESGLRTLVDQAADIEQAVELYQTKEYHCLVIDYMIGPYDGFDLLKRLQDKRDCTPGIVMLTGMGNEDVAVRAMKRGVHDYISKDDLNCWELSSAIQNAASAAVEDAKKKVHDEQMRQMSLYDQLTGLPNRNLFLDRFNSTIEINRRHKTGFAVLLMDLDGFKAINDNHGHHVGDEILRVIGQRLQQTSRETDTFARMGGDEFTAILPDTDSIEGAITIARKLLDAVCEPIAIDDNILNVGLSIGIALYPHHSEDAHSLLHAADQAMYSAKRAQQGYSVYDAEAIDSEIHRATQIAEALPNICKDDSLVLCYQPQICLADGALSGAEVLIRWRHPELGLLPPAEFVPAAERSNVIRELTYRVIEQAVERATAWQEIGLELPISVNVSTRILADHDVPVRVMRILEEHKLRPDLLTLEITESALITEPRRTRKMLESLATEGLNISVDDFGTGYSSLKYLRDFPVNELKIDKTFVAHVMQESRDISIIEAIIRLAQGFGAKCVAEGIENRSTWNRLQQLGCDFGQGFAIAKPLPEAEFLDWWHRWEQDIQANAVGNG